MGILLDTHIFLWWLEDDPKLSLQGRRKIATASEVFISSASIWEAAIKIGNGKLQADIHELVDAIGQNGFKQLRITATHAARVAALPRLHNDPFDRLLISQSICESIRLITADKILQSYSSKIELV